MDVFLDYATNDGPGQRHGDYRPRSSMSRKQKCYELCCSTRFLVLVVTLVIVGSLVVAFSVRVGKNGSSSVPVVNRQEVIRSKIIAQGITSEADLKKSNSAASKALQFLVKTDEAQLSPDDPNLMDRYVLAVLYYSTQPQDQKTQIYSYWKNKENWMSMTSVCEWHGIDCEDIQDRKNVVVHVNLAANQLQGTLPSELHGLKDLVQLNLSGNHLSGPIPDAIGQMTSLHYLMLQDNVLTGKLPNSIGKLSEAEEIILSNNKFEGRLPESIGHLTKLRKLKVDHNMFTGDLPAEWKLTRISELSILTKAFCLVLVVGNWTVSLNPFLLLLLV